MTFLTDLLVINEGSDLTELTPDIITDIQKNIRKGASDTEQKWANALHLVQKAYEISGVQRPDPDMKAAWKQYEENITYSVQQLAKFRGMDADWRMSAHVFHEAMTRQMTYRVSSEGANEKDTYQVAAKSLDELIDGINSKNTDLYDIDVKKADDGRSATLMFSKWGIKKNYRLKIEQNNAL